MMGSVIYSEKMGGLISNMVEFGSQMEQLIKAYNGKIYADPEDEQPIPMSQHTEVLDEMRSGGAQVGDVYFYCLDEDTNEYIGPFFPYSATPLAQGGGLSVDVDNGKVNVAAGKGITVDGNGVNVAAGEGITVDDDNKVTLKLAGIVPTYYTGVSQYFIGWGNFWDAPAIGLSAPLTQITIDQSKFITPDKGYSVGLKYDETYLSIADNGSLTLSSDMITKIAKYDQLLKDFETLKAEVEALKSSN